MGIIYIIKSHLIDQVYIGQTTKTQEIRWGQHKNKANKYINAVTVEDINKLNGMHQKLYIAMKTYGIDNFTIESIAHAENAELDELEKYYIEKYDSVVSGLNMKNGGNRTSHTENVRAFISKRTKEAFNDIKTVEKMRKHDILKDLPPKCTYHKNSNQEGIRVRRHRLCKDKLFELKNYSSIDECKKDVITFINNLESKNIPYEGGRDKECKNLPAGFRKLQNGYKIQKTFNGKRYTKMCTKKKTDMENFEEAKLFLNKLLTDNNIPVVVVNYNELD